jgi:tRNA(Met) cytidine acetyltransferase
VQADILAGTRRPAGDLLPQALAYKWQLLAPMQWRWWRIVRIAVSASKRRQGRGSGLIKELRVAAQQQQIDAIGSSFGAADEVMAFWQANNFQLVHRGVKRQMASGHVNAMVAFGNSKSACQVIQQKLIEVAL